MALDALLDAIERLPAFHASPQHAARARRAADRRRAARFGRRRARRGARAPSADALLRRRRRRRRRSGALARRPRRRCSTTTPVALYPPREGFGEAEPHVEVAGERVETLERLTRGELRVLLTTARALLERTRLPRALQELRVELRKGDDASAERARRASRAHRLRARADGRGRRAVQHARRNLRRLLLRHGRSGARSSSGATRSSTSATSTSHRSARRATVDLALVLPVDGQRAARTRRRVRARVDPVALSAGHAPRRSARRAHRAGAAAHLGRGAAPHRPRAPARRGRRRARRAVRVARRRAAQRSRAFGTIARRRPGADESRTSSSRSARPEPIDRDIKRLRRLVRDGMPTIILCDNEGQAERLDELLNEDDARAVAGGAVDRRAATAASSSRRADARAPGFASSPTTRSSAASAASVARAATSPARRSRRSRAQARRLRRAPRARRRHLSRHRDDLRRRRARSKSRSSSTRAATGSTSRSIASTRSSATARAGDVADDAPPPRLHKLGGKRWAQQRDQTRAAIQEMTVELLDLYARRKVAIASAARSRHAVAAPARVVASCSRTRPISARRPPT